MEKIDFWKLCDELTVVQAALLIAGYDPSDYLNIDRWSHDEYPEGYEAAKNAVLSGLNKERIEGQQKYTPRDINDHEPSVCPSSSVVDVESLKSWLWQKNFDSHFFFPKVEVSDYLDKTHPRYTPKLAAVVHAWESFEDNEPLQGRTPKQALKKWLREHAAEYGLCDEDGKPNETVISGLAQIPNWQTKGGAPRTPVVTKDIDKKKAGKQSYVEASAEGAKAR